VGPLPSRDPTSMLRGLHASPKVRMFCCWSGQHTSTTINYDAAQPSRPSRSSGNQERATKRSQLDHCSILHAGASFHHLWSVICGLCYICIGIICSTITARGSCPNLFGQPGAWLACLSGGLAGKASNSVHARITQRVRVQHSKQLCRH
jgi:hypothetical protein